MRQSQFPLKTSKEAPKDEEATNAVLLTRAGFIQKLAAGIYSFLPFGLRVIRNIENIVRQEMNAIGSQEVLLPALHPKEYWVKTGRWELFDALYRLKAKENREYALGSSHEEVIVPLVKHIISSYKDLPLYLYQIQTKFRDEPRAKSGLLRGREFIMKDLYSFHRDQEDLDAYYEKVGEAYETIFKRCGLDAIKTEASGGTFSKFSHEYQVVTRAGEDIIFHCGKCGFARNKEVMGSLPHTVYGSDQRRCPNCRSPLKERKASEVGNIFKLGVKYSEPFELRYQAREGIKREVIMGCYGIGVSRLMGTIVEVHNDKSGIIWPESVAPFALHALKFKVQSEKFKVEQDKIYEALQKRGLDVLYDDRGDVSDGQKLVEADLIGIPWRVVISERTLKEGKVEVKRRSEKEAILMTVEKFIDQIGAKNPKFK